MANVTQQLVFINGNNTTNEEQICVTNPLTLHRLGQFEIQAYFYLYSQNYKAHKALRPLWYRMCSQNKWPQHNVMSVKSSNNALWGRRGQVSALSGFLSMSLVIISPLLVLFTFISLLNFNGSILEAGERLLASSPMEFFFLYSPSLKLRTGAIYACWVAFQAILYLVLPGKIVTGAQTPGGNTLSYKVNGLSSWCVTVCALSLITWTFGLSTAAGLANNWGELLVSANIYGIAMSILAWVKGSLIPSSAKDRRRSGSIFHDFLSGIELNPRFGKEWDIKLFEIGHLGMNSWVIIDLSFAAQQYRQFGSLSNSMLIVILLHTVYVVDFFINEAWYLNTIDIVHDHYGFYLAWGSAVWLPYIYTTQAQYLAYHPIDLPSEIFYTILSAGIFGYIFFRLANHQKHLVRTRGINCQIAGQKPTVIPSRYTTESTGEVHESLLLCSGCWAIVRHPNYVGDLIFSFCTCVCCGWQYLVPYTYFIWMAVLLIHRCLRDEKRCLAKHGKAWEEYRRIVRWRMIPGIF